MEVYSGAHRETFTEENVKAAFAKTGVLPFDPSVISTEQMAPSLENSIHACPSVLYSTPVKILVNNYSAILDEQDKTHDVPGTPSPPGSPSPHHAQNSFHPSSHRPISTPRRLQAALASSSSTAFLVRPSPTHVSSSLPPSLFEKARKLPPINWGAIGSPHRHGPPSMLLSRPDLQRQVDELADTARAAKERCDFLEEQHWADEAKIGLLLMETTRLKRKLARKQEKKSQKKLKIDLGGKAHILTDDDFRDVIERVDAQKLADEDAKIARVEARRVKAAVKESKQAFTQDRQSAWAQASAENARMESEWKEEVARSKARGERVPRKPIKLSRAEVYAAFEATVGLFDMDGEVEGMEVDGQGRDDESSSSSSSEDDTDEED